MKNLTKIEFGCRLNAKNWNWSHVSYGLETGICFESDDEGVIYTSSETFRHVFLCQEGNAANCQEGDPYALVDRQTVDAV